MTDADTRIDSLKDDIRALSYTLLDVQEKATGHDAKFAEIDRRFDQVDARLNRIDGRLDGHDGRFDQIDAKLAEILVRLPQRPQ